jgi:uncharacterized protein YjiK
VPNFLSRKFLQKFAVTLIGILALALVFFDTNPWKSSSGEPSPLDGMKFSRVIHLPESVTDLSGITFDPNDNTLYAVSNKPPEIFQISLDGKLLRRIRLRGFKDTEGVEYLGNGKFAVLDESLHEIIRITITPETSEIHYRDGEKQQFNIETLGQPPVKNRGFEGITLNRDGKLLIANEQYPVLIGTIQNTGSNTDNFNLYNTFTSPGKDIAGLHYWATHDRLLALSEASRNIVVFNADGKMDGTYHLTYDRLGLWPRIEQPEGITADAKRIYIAAEPNLIYVLE